LTTRDGDVLAARLVVDASGHFPVLVRRPDAPAVAYQAAYGLVGRFSAPPVAAGQMVLMDYRADHLTDLERAGPPTFLYAMDLGDGVYFVEETSLAHAPAVSLDLLERRLHRRLAYQGVRVEEVQHVERCLFPMDLPLPDLRQPVLGYGGAASMVHPATGYQVGAALSRAPEVAAAIVEAFAADASPDTLARAGWAALWPAARVRRRNLYLFGLASLLRFDTQQTQDFFAAFFHLPRAEWAGYLSDRLTTPELVQTMLRLFAQAPAQVRSGLLASVGRSGGKLWDALRG
jgi:lycopene beta-cyclase